MARGTVVGWASRRDTGSVRIGVGYYWKRTPGGWAGSSGILPRVQGFAGPGNRLTLWGWDLAGKLQRVNPPSAHESEPEKHCTPPPLNRHPAPVPA